MVLFKFGASMSAAYNEHYHRNQYSRILDPQLRKEQLLKFLT